MSANARAELVAQAAKTSRTPHRCRPAVSVMISMRLEAGLLLQQAVEHASGSRAAYSRGADRGSARRRRAVRSRRHQRPPRRPRAVQQVELVLARRRLRPAARRLVAEPDVSTARARSLFMDIDSAASTPILKGTGQPSDAQLSALRADRARVSPGRAARRLQRAGHRPGRRARSALGARLRRHARRRRRDQSHHRRAT